MKRRPVLFFFSCFLVAAIVTPVQISAQLTHADITIREEWITMPDSTRLAADLYLPASWKQGERLPVLLEYLPYRKEESRKSRFALFSYFVRRGYVVARVDIRGTGSSEGKLIAYEYTDEEQRDGEVIIDWLSRQSFSNGNIGMFGISWGGFNAIHMAMRKPPALKAIIAMMATDDLYEDDVHYMDGMMHIDAYEIGQDIANILPGAPEFVIDEKYFRNRFDTKPWLLTYKQQQRDGAFWDRASLNADYSKLTIPTFLISGWYDGYRDSTPRILKNVKTPVKAIIGPWNHNYPNLAEPPPAIEWRKEAVRWFDHWLKDEKNGIMDDPPFTFFIRDYHAPGTNLKNIPGTWKRSDGWPDDALRYDTMILQTDHTLQFKNSSEARHALDNIPSVGVEAGGSVMWWGDWAPDQKRADSLSLVYETSPLSEDVVLLGFPTVLLNVSTSSPHTNWFARLVDVDPSGAATLVTGAGMNGTHRTSAMNPEWMEINKVYQLPVEMHFTSWTFRKGHRIRLAIHNSLWPMIWPVAFPLKTSIVLGGRSPSRFILPVISDASSLHNADFAAPESDPELPGYLSLESGTPSGFAETDGVVRDAKTRTANVVATNAGTDLYPWGKVKYTEHITHRTNDLDPARTSVESLYTITAELPGRTLRWETSLSFKSDKKNFYYHYTRKLFQDKKLLRKKIWKETIARDFQ